jgi:hypothetical protein
MQDLLIIELFISSLTYASLDWLHSFLHPESSFAQTMNSLHECEIVNISYPKMLTIFIENEQDLIKFVIAIQAVHYLSLLIDHNLFWLEKQYLEFSMLCYKCTSQVFIYAILVSIAMSLSIGAFNYMGSVKMYFKTIASEGCLKLVKMDKGEREIITKYLFIRINSELMIQIFTYHAIFVLLIQLCHVLRVIKRVIGSLF